MIDNSKEYILCAAIKRIKPRKHKICDEENDLNRIEIGYRHGDIYARFNKLSRFQNYILKKLPYKYAKKLMDLWFEVGYKIEDQGFYTSKGRFVNRVEGMKIAYEAGQVSENRALYKYGELDIYLGIKYNPNRLYNHLASEDLY